MLNRRNFLAGFLASATVAAQPGFALAAAKDKKTDPLTAFYLQVTRQSYDAVFKGPLSADNIQSADDVKNALESNWGAYQAAFINNAQALIAQNGSEGLSDLTQPHKGGRGLSLPLQKDSGLYTRSGRVYSKEKSVQTRTGKEETNPLFLRVHDLALEGKISREAARDAIVSIQRATFSEAIHAALKEAVLAGQKAATPEAGATLKLQLK